MTTRSILSRRTEGIPIEEEFIPIRRKTFSSSTIESQSRSNRNYSINNEMVKIHEDKQGYLIKEKWLHENKMDFSLEEEKDIPQFKSDYKIGTWSPNEPFVLHFLLDGFLSDNLGNVTANVANRFIELLTNMKTEWGLTMSEEIKKGKNHGSYKEDENKKVKVFDTSKTLEEYVDEQIKRTEPIRHNMIVAGGYGGAKGGHATAFRFLPLKRQIIFINSGQGLQNHPKNPLDEDFIKLYYFWQFSSDEEFQYCARTIIGGIDCPYIDNITDAYTYQVNIKPNKRVNKIFKDKGVVSKSSPIWITDISNWRIHNGELYCKQQITGTCSFHSIYWMLLFDVWVNGDSLKASQFEKKSRNFVLEKGINLGKPTGNRISEQISCLNLLVRVYRNFKGRDTALKTLLLDPETYFTLRSPIVDRNLVTEEAFTLFTNISSLLNLIEELLEEKILNNCLSILLKLLDLLANESQISQNNAMLLEKEQLPLAVLFRLHLMQLAIGAIKYVGEITKIKTSTVREVILATKCYNTYKWMEYDQALNSSLRIDSICILIIARIHSALPLDKQLPAHPIKYYYTDTIILNNTKCEVDSFVRNYAMYAYQSKLNLYSNIVKQWVENTPSSPDQLQREESNFFEISDLAKERGLLSQVDKVFISFITNNSLGDCIAAIFRNNAINPHGYYSFGMPNLYSEKKFLYDIGKSIFPAEPKPDTNKHLKLIEDLKKIQVNIEISTNTFEENPTSSNIKKNINDIEEAKIQLAKLEKFNKQVPREGNRKGTSNALAFLTDLNSGVLLEEMSYNSFSLPSYEKLSHSCNEEETSTVLEDGVANAIPDNFYSLRREWEINTWLKVIPQIQGITSNSDALTVCTIWLFYLWPTGPPLINGKPMMTLFNLPIKNKIVPLIANMLTLWLSKGEVGSIKSYIKYAKIHPEDTRERKNTSHINQQSRIEYTLRLFGECIFYFPNLAVKILSKCNTSMDTKEEPEEDENIRANEVFMLKDVELYPTKLRTLNWKEDSMATYQENKRHLVSIKNTQNSLQGVLYNRARQLRIISAIWQKESDIKVELYFEEDIITISGTQLTLPSGEEYNLALPQEIPLLMRQWCQDYNDCLVIPLKQLQDGIFKWFILLAGTKNISMGLSIFDKKEDVMLKYGSAWYIYPMQTSNVMPILNRDTPGWIFLLAHLNNSVKTACLELLRPIIPTLRANLVNPDTDTMKFLNHGLVTPSRFISESQRKYYMKYLTEEFDITDPEYNTLEYRLWSIISVLSRPLEVKKYLYLLVNIVNNILGGENLTPRTTSQAMFEAISGKIMRREQIKLVKKMRHDLEAKEAKVRIALMGIGKSKILVPMLVILCIINKKPVTIIQPNHLVPQTLVTLDEIIPLLFVNADYKVISEVEAKREYLTARKTNTAFDNNRVVLFDEIDSMYNPFRSEYNIPSNRILHPLVLEDMPLEVYYQLVVDHSYEKEVYYTEEQLNFIHNFSKFYAKFQDDVKAAKKLKHLFHYGLNEIDKDEIFLAVPYSAVSTPIPGAIFSDIDLMAILSCLIRKKSGLNVRDFTLLLHRIQHWKKIIGIDKILSYNIKELVAIGPENLALQLGGDVALQRFYLQYILLPEKLYCFKHQYNLSFVDLMSPDYSTQRIGFSGTDSITLPRFETYNWVEVVPDLIGEAKIRDSIIGWESSEIGIEEYSYDELWNKLLGFDVLIDADALLRNHGDSIQIVKKWAEKESKLSSEKYVYIFIDNMHIAREYNLGQINNFSNYKYREDSIFRYYFDQKHTVGIDLQLPLKARAITLLRDSSRLKDVAQAIYRLRKIGEKGQSTQFMLKGEIPANRKELYDLLKRNDKRYNYSFLKRHYMQNVKTLIRIEEKHNPESYKEEVKYYSDEVQISLLKSRSKLVKELLIKEKELENKASDDIDIQHEQEQDQEQEQEQEQVFKFNEDIHCYSGKELYAEDEQYLDSNFGYVEPGLNISISPYVIDEENKASICVILLPHKHCKIITIAEELLIKSRNRIKCDFRHRHEEIPIGSKANYILALGICGRHLTLDEQLLIIKKLPDKDALIKIAHCFKVLQYDILLDYLNSYFDSITYLANFTRDYEVFLRRWVLWPIKLDVIYKYWQRCLKIIQK